MMPKKIVWLGLAFLGACGAPDPSQPPAMNMSAEAKVCLADPPMKGDEDRDGVQAAQVFAQCVPQSPTPDLRPGEDWCPQFPGDAAHHGCPNGETGQSCDVPGLFSDGIILRNRYDYAFAFPFGSFCQPSGRKNFQSATQWLTITGLGDGRDDPGTWLEMREGQQLTTPFAVAVSGCTDLKGTEKVTWRLKNGTTGDLAVSGCANRDVSYCSLPHSDQGRDGCYFSLPMDGTLASLTASPGVNLTLFFPAIDRTIRTDDSLTADGREIPRGFLKKFDCVAGACVF